MLSLSNTLYLMTVMFACILLSYVSFEQIFDAPTLAYATAYALIFAVSMLGVTACATALRAPLISSVSVFLSRTICWLTFAMTLAVSQLKR